MDPVNFNFADPSAAILGGIKQSAVLGQIRRDAQDRQLAMQAAQVKQQQALQQQQDLQRVAMNPNATPQDYARLMTQYPALAEHLGKAAKTLEDGQRQNLLDFNSRLFSAQMSGNGELFDSLLTERKAADPANAQHYQMLVDLNKANPAAARSILGMQLAASLGPDKFAESYAKLGGEQRAQEKQPFEVKKAEADARTAESTAVIKAEEAKVAPQSVLLDLQKKGWDITKIQADIAHQKESNRIAAMNAAANREGNDLKRQELKLKIAETQQKLDDKVREKVAKAEKGAASIDNMLNTLERLMKNPRLNDVVGTIEGRMPALTNDDSADAIALIDTIGSQAFITQVQNVNIPGALTEKEGDKLQASLQNLSRVQSEKQFRASANEAMRLMKKAREGISREYGVPLGKPDTPAAPGARPPLSSFDGKK